MTSWKPVTCWQQVSNRTMVVRGNLRLKSNVCPACGAVIDRDMNAAVNLMKSGVVNPSVPVETASTRCR